MLGWDAKGERADDVGYLYAEDKSLCCCRPR